MTSENWAGFTDEDIKKIKSNPKLSKSCNVQICEIDGSASKNKGPMKIKNIPLKYKEDSSLNECKTKEVSSSYKNLSLLKESEYSSKEMENEDNSITNCIEKNYQENSMGVPLRESISNDDLHEPSIGEKCDEPVQSNSSLPPLEVFEMRQKRIEAENARRRALINKAINDKKMRTQAEAMKLAQITHELNRIDSSLSADVSILRNYIEKASLEFSEAEKRYLKAEKEYVEAKLVLFEKMQRKEMLTEHLCAIIEQNENRKADKLVELMKQLEMEAIVQDYDVNGSQPILPSLCLLNDETYHCCQTLKPSLSKQCLQEQISEAVKESVVSEDVLQKSHENVCDNVNIVTNESAGEDSDAKA